MINDLSLALYCFCLSLWLYLKKKLIHILCSLVFTDPPGTVAFTSSSVHGDSPGKNAKSGLPCPPPRDLPNPGITPRSPTLRTDSLPAEPAGKPKNTGVDSLSLLQGIFPTQRLNPGLLHCRQIPYRLSH